MLKRISLLATFAVATLVFAIMQLPPQLVLKPILDSNGIRYAAIEGYLFDLQFERAAISGFSVDWLELKTSIFSMLTGQPTFEGSFRAHNGSGSFVAKLDENIIQFEALNVVHDVNAKSAFSDFSGALSVHSTDAVISLDNGCHSGVFQLRSDILEFVLSSFGLQSSPLVGNAICRDDGILYVELAANTADVDIRVSGRVETQQNWSNPDIQLSYFLMPKVDREFPIVLISRLETAGLHRAGRGFSGTLTLNVS